MHTNQTTREKAIITLLQKAKKNGGTVTFLNETSKRRMPLTEQFFYGKTLIKCYKDLENLLIDFGAKKYVIN